MRFCRDSDFADEEEENVMIGNMKRIIHILIILSAVAVSVLFIQLFIGIRPYVVLSGSMKPVISTGSLCFVNTRSSYKKIKMGDIIAYEKGGMLVIHRSVRVTKSGIETKGDANRISDGITTTAANYKGKMIYSIPFLGYVLHFFLSLVGKSIAVMCISLYLLYQILFEKKGDKVKV